MAQFDRVYQYKAIFSRKRAISKQALLAELEISEATFKRDLDKMRDFYNYDNLRVQPKPKQQPPEVWLGGIAESELKRVGRLADGWLPSFVTPEDAKAGWATATQVAAEHNREIDAEHFGVLIPYVIGEHSEAFLNSLKTRRPDIDDLTTLVPNSWASLSALMEKFIAVGASKFVVIPSKEPSSVNEWNDHLADAATHLLPLQN
jgi:alkanesulfonate monooxygenase SsuD/methylene tetrahydromethanopterin reductase-like flavin-dependent oxidoreductase (luciferase family)